MNNLILEKVPSKLKFSTKTVDFDTFAKSFIEYMEDIEDVQKVTSEMKKNTESFDYSNIRNEYV